NLGRLTGTTTSYSFLSGRTLTTGYGYDAASNRTSFTDPEGGVSSYGYDSDNRLTSLASATSGSFSFSYDGLSRRTSITRPDGISANYTYDSLSRLLSVLDQTRKATLDGAAYTYDPAGNRLSRQDYRTGTMSNFAYDAIYQLLQVTQAGQPTETYSYDDVGNRLSSLGVSPYSYDSSNQLNSQPGVTYSYDSNGNLLSKTDSNGTTSYTWDAENRLSSVTLPGSGGTVTYQYEPFGRRIEKVSPSGTTIYAYDGDNVVEELDGGGMAVARYAQGLGIDEPLAMYRGGASYYYNADGLGSITSLTNASGQIAASYTYDSFGKLTASTGTVTNPFRYTGREYGTDTGLYYYRARYYDASVGRFISEDPIGFSGGGTNFYAYVSNDPVLFIDQTGNAPDGPCLDIDKFLKWVDGHAAGASQHHCAKAVRLGMEAGGLDTAGHPGLAKDYGPFLQKLGFLPVSPENYSSQKGDVIVFQPGPSPAGHVEVWDGATWVSDFMQHPNRISPYSGDTTPYRIYRFPNPCP
ncbi:MAG TPA: RHS repeat-associated core domain-containing protein, partial [Terriglobales bacterium]|nr:RHS repeat-associated core domain-containing protein [Terriglobales bacterium]